MREIDKIRQIKHDKLKREISVFDKIYRKIIRKIESIVKKTEYITGFEYVIPSSIVGEHYYDSYRCYRYITLRLRKDGLKTMLLHSNPNIDYFHIYIEWKEDEHDQNEDELLLNIQPLNDRKETHRKEILSEFRPLTHTLSSTDRIQELIRKFGN